MPYPRIKESKKHAIDRSIDADYPKRALSQHYEFFFIQEFRVRFNLNHALSLRSER